jgi:hypothetical protein
MLGKWHCSRFQEQADVDHKMDFTGSESSDEPSSSIRYNSFAGDLYCYLLEEKRDQTRKVVSTVLHNWIGLIVALIFT